MPTALARPWPSGPVVVSTPGVTPTSGWPGVIECSCRKRRSSSIGKAYPVRCSSEYCSIEPWPLESIKRSRSAHFGLPGLWRRWRFHKATAISAMPMGMPGWPELAACTASMDRARIALASSAVLVFMAGGKERRRDYRRSGAIFPLQPPKCRSARKDTARLGAALAVHELQDHGRENQLHRQFHLSARRDDDVRPRHERVVQHGEQVRQVDPLGIGEADHEEALVGARDVARDERVRGVDRGHALEIDMRLRELRHDVIHVIGH